MEKDTQEFLSTLPLGSDPIERRPIGRPIKAGSGTMVISVSIPYGYKDLMIRYGISPSNAIQEGILMLLNNNDKFPQSAYDEMQVKGLFVEKRKAFAAMLSKTV